LRDALPALGLVPRVIPEFASANIRDPAPHLRLLLIPEADALAEAIGDLPPTY